MLAERPRGGTSGAEASVGDAASCGMRAWLRGAELHATHPAQRLGEVEAMWSGTSTRVSHLQIENGPDISVKPLVRRQAQSKGAAGRTPRHSAVFTNSTRPEHERSTMLKNPWWKHVEGPFPTWEGPLVRTADELDTMLHGSVHDTQWRRVFARAGVQAGWRGQPPRTGQGWGHGGPQSRVSQGCRRCVHRGVASSVLCVAGMPWEYQRFRVPRVPGARCSRICCAITQATLHIE